ncbi:hypothetical protein CHLRE_03g158350v5 [Chlamydomonas reinhardtii]|uniref:Uncharacterized protein n=1 Tax=Chlamydomonas reinhardtii TaxID=3055 RepID=A0A2K3DW65_CHLRE|nr:uncharacterized protein CHLRE_03g158350v5 [Chlamydomonas reinhardtii]PNW84778.1 hypothetical protein CHLRE_03g158350v5 [Chlamydomonas reinhardtii]
MLHRGGGFNEGSGGGGAAASAANGSGSLARHLLAPLGCSGSNGGGGGGIGGFGGVSSSGRHHHTLLPLDTQGAAGCKAKPSPAKVRRRWDTAHRVCNGLLMALGLWLAVSSSATMMGPAAAHGLVLGGGLVALGGLGLAASGRDCLSLRSLLLLGLGVAGLSTMDLMQQVGRDVGTHCALAEAHTRIRHLEGRLEAMRHDELITQLFFRMNEMDDMLGLMQQAAVASTTEAVEKHTAVFRAAQADKDYLRAKAASLRRHAVAVAEALRARAAESKANGTLQGGGDSVADSLWSVERRLEAVESVVRYLDSKEAGGDLSYEEYEIILEALLEGSQGHATHHTAGQLQQEKSGGRPGCAGLHSVKAVYERHVAGAYDHVAPAAGLGAGGATFMAAAGVAGAPGAGAGVAAGAAYPLGGRSPGGGAGASAGIGAVTKAQARKESSRRHFENRFMDIFNQHGAHHAAAFRSSLGAAMESLPEHCVRDVDARQRLGVLGWALLATQFAAGYTALTAYTLVAKKDD